MRHQPSRSGCAWRPALAAGRRGGQRDPHPPRERAELVTHRFPLAGIAEAFRVLRDRDGDPVKIVVVP